MNKKGRAVIEELIRRQKLWIAEHGGTLEGYILKYGSVDTPGHFGRGGAWIFSADQEELTRLQAKLT